MALHATPFLLVSLGCEMLYVVEQRLRAQAVPRDTAGRALAELAALLLHERLQEAAWSAAPAPPQGALRRLLVRAAGAALVRLDERSSGKLWELVTQVARWQLQAQRGRSQLFDLARRHLRGVAALLPPAPAAAHAHRALDRARRRFDTLSSQFTARDLQILEDTLLNWFSGFRTKISVLLRLGLQNQDGSFTPAERIDPRILDNLGENIYEYEARTAPLERGLSNADTDEISCIIYQIATVTNQEESTIELRLPIEFGAGSTEDTKVLHIKRNTKFESLDIDVRSRGEDLAFEQDIPRSTRDDLLVMLEPEIEDEQNLI